MRSEIVEASLAATERVAAQLDMVPIPRQTVEHGICNECQSLYGRCPTMMVDSVPARSSMMSNRMD
ncbi:hypothetical protein NM680_14605, partial [Paracoccus sp. PS-1]|uniref:hypothetical protein n=1 Tax=Paracoccus sp. PS1 TaxID=2963938 RepID=UPI0027E51A90